MVCDVEALSKVPLHRAEVGETSVLQGLRQTSCMICTVEAQLAQQHLEQAAILNLDVN